MIELPDVIYWFLFLTFGESREQKRCQKIGNWPGKDFIYTQFSD